MSQIEKTICQGSETAEVQLVARAKTLLVLKAILAPVQFHNGGGWHSHYHKNVATLR
jgi:hypothetical protein